MNPSPQRAQSLSRVVQIARANTAERYTSEYTVVVSGKGGVVLAESSDWAGWVSQVLPTFVRLMRPARGGRRGGHWAQVLMWLTGAGYG